MKKRSVPKNQNYPNAFSQAWENELNRYMFGHFLTPFNYGIEFSSEFQFDESNLTNSQVKVSDKVD